MIDISSYFGSLAALASLTVILTGYLNTHVLAGLPSTGKQIASWCVAVVLAFVGQMKGVGFVADTSFVWTAINGLAVGLIANGIFDVKIVQSILEFVKAKK